MKIQAANPQWRAILEAAAQGDLLFLQKAYKTATTLTTPTTCTNNQHEEEEQDDDAAAAAAAAADDVGSLLFETAICSSGCFALHWVAGSCSCPKKARRVIHFLIKECGVDVNQRAKSKSMGRTPLFYCCRNGKFETARVLVHEYGADPNATAKSGVTPFQLACWRNQLDIAKWLVNDCHVDAHQTNDFDCGALHWLALCPAPEEEELIATTTAADGDGQDLVPTATWLVEQCGLDCRARQRQGHNALHKAAWGGHLALCRYLHEVQDMWDDQPDGAGYYAVDLAEMAHKTKVSAAAAAASKKNRGKCPANDSNNNNKTTTSRHAQVAAYLRRVCSRTTLQSCRVLNITLEQANANNAEDDARKIIRRAYHVAVRRCHPDKRTRLQNGGGRSSPTTSTTTSTAVDTAHSNEATCAAAAVLETAMNDRFLQVTAAYRHLMQVDEQDHGYLEDTNDNGVLVTGGGGNSRRCYRNQRAIPFLLPPLPSPPSPPSMDNFVETTNDINNPQGTLAFNTATATTSSTCTSAADDEAWLTQSRLRIVLQQYGRCGSRGDDHDDNEDGGGGGSGTNATTTSTAGVVEGLDLSNLRKWWNRCWPDVPLPVNKRNLKAWIRTQQAVVYMRRDDKGVVRLYIKEQHRGQQQQQRQ